MMTVCPKPLRLSAAVAAGLGLAACSVGLDASPPGPRAASAWAIERQVAHCHATRSGGTRTAGAAGGRFFVFGSVTAISRTDSPADCAAILALTDEDVEEIRTLVLAAGASARGMETDWRSRAGARRELVLSVYPVEASRGRPCRAISATISVFGGPAGSLVGAPPAVQLDEQRMCRSPAGTWEPD